jgi:hypothetical protein
VRPLLAFDLLREAKVGDHDVASRIQQQILGLQVAVDEAVVVQMHQRRRNLGRVQDDALLREFAAFLQVEKELTAVDKVEDHVQLLRRLEGEVQLDDEWVLDLLQNVLLVLRVRDLNISIAELKKTN